jgi:hypothetical protein
MIPRRDQHIPSKIVGNFSVLNWTSDCILNFSCGSKADPHRHMSSLTPKEDDDLERIMMSCPATKRRGRRGASPLDAPAWSGADDRVYGPDVFSVR